VTGQERKTYVGLERSGEANDGLICRRAELPMIRVGDGLHGHNFSNWRWMLITEFTVRMVE
jgi:hypothetical protein